MRGLSERVVMITGAGGGIGSATARRFAEEGSIVIALDRAAEAVAAVAHEIGATGARIEPAVASVVGHHGGVDILVNNAGWDVFKPFLQTSVDEWLRLIDINLVGALHMLHLVLPGMAERGFGRVVNVSSDAARVGSSGEAVYAACKGGLVSLTKTLAREHARHGITCNVVCPGPTDTALFDGFRQGASNPEKLEEAFRRSIPLGRIGQPDDLPGAILFFASDDAAFVTGQVLSVSGGLTMVG
ncbi:MAG: SDR family oxidoreductase [Ilumatobacteraceae bacterium]